MQSVLFAVGIPCLGKSVGVNQQGITGLDRKTKNWKVCARKHPEWHARRTLRLCSARAEMQKREVSRADNFDRSIARSPSDDKCRELSCHRALGKNAIRDADHPVERQLRVGQAAKRGMQVAHQHRSADPFARNIPEQKYQAGFRLKDIAIVAADHSRWSIVIAHLPAARSEIPRWQQSLLNPRRQQEITLKRTALLNR